MGGMPLALITTRSAGGRAGFDHCPEDVQVRLGLTDRDPGGGVAGVGAVEAEANAAHHLVHVGFGEIGVGTTRAAGATFAALFDTAEEGAVVNARRLWMCLDDVLNRHMLSSLGYCRSGDGGIRVLPRIPSTTNATSST